MRLAASRRRLTYEAHVQAHGAVVPVAINPRCTACDKVLANYLTAPYSVQCPRCGAINQVGPLPPALPPATPGPHLPTATAATT